MSDRDGRTWSIGRYLLVFFLPFLLLAWAVFAGAVLVLTFGIDLWGTVTRSVWDPAVTIVRWFALGFGVYLVNRVLPVFVAHGRTRREFLRALALFVVVSASVLAALLAFGFVLEALLFRAMDWPHQLAAGRLFSAPDQYPLVFASYLGMLVVWSTIGLLLAAGFHRSGGWELVVLPLAVAMVVVSELGTGFNGLPFVGAVVERAEVPLAATLALCLAAVAPGAAVTWALVRDLPIRSRTV